MAEEGVCDQSWWSLGGFAGVLTSAVGFEGRVVFIQVRACSGGSINPAFRSWAELRVTLRRRVRCCVQGQNPEIRQAAPGI